MESGDEEGAAVRPDPSPAAEGATPSPTGNPAGSAATEEDILLTFLSAPPPPPAQPSPSQPATGSLPEALPVAQSPPKATTAQSQEVCFSV